MELTLQAWRVSKNSVTKSANCGKIFPVCRCLRNRIPSLFHRSWLMPCRTPEAPVLGGIWTAGTSKMRQSPQSLPHLRGESSETSSNSRSEERRVGKSVDPCGGGACEGG